MLKSEMITKLISDGSYSVNPSFQLFKLRTNGMDYQLLESSANAERIIQAFTDYCMMIDHSSHTLEIRCNGQRISF